jgi:hypothetical protein
MRPNDVQSISLADIRWFQSFPLVVSPRTDEWFVGLLLRCDEANLWESGGTLIHLLQTVQRIKQKKDANLVIPALRVIDQFAECLALPTEQVLVTTFYTELARCYGTVSPHPAQLNRVLPFRICPGCLRDARLLMRSSVLTHLQFCPFHQVALVSSCQCGSRLKLFEASTSPFVCSECGMDWGSLPCQLARPDQMRQEQKVWSFYRFFLGQGTPQILARTVQYIRHKMKGEKIRQAKLLDGTTMRAEHYELRRHSLSYLVNVLVSLGIDLSEIAGGLPVSD